MANVVNYAELWEKDLLEIFIQESLISPFITNNVRFLGDGRTFHFTQMSTTGFKNHSRDGGWNKGSFTQTDVPFTLMHDRDVSFLVDKADVVESNATASMLHTEVTSLIQEHRREKGEPPAAMLAVYNYLHDRHMEKANKIKLLQAEFKK